MSPDPNLVTVSVIGTDAAAANAPASPITSGTVATTPGAQPDVRFNVVAPAMAILVRFIHVFLVSFAGLIATAGIGAAEAEPGSAMALVALGTVLKGAAWTSLIIAGVETVKNLVTIFGRLESKYPLATGSI